jgi:hypothetical protein
MNSDGDRDRDGESEETKGREHGGQAGRQSNVIYIVEAVYSGQVGAV